MEQENQQSGQAQPQQTFVVIGKPKSVGVALLLALLFGPLGLMYSSVSGGVIMLILSIIIGLITVGIGLVFVWIGCVIWAVVAANNANNKAAVSTQSKTPS